MWEVSATSRDRRIHAMARAAAATSTSASQQWIADSGPFPTLAEARELAKTLEGGRWKTNPSNPGDGKSRCGFVCNYHQECERQMRVIRICGEYFIEFKGKHVEKLSERKRKNSTLGWDAEAMVDTAIVLGNKPGQLRVAMTLEKSEELKSKKMDPLLHKNPDGGLIGKQMPCLLAHTDAYVCMVHVYRMYAACMIIHMYNAIYILCM